MVFLAQSTENKQAVFSDAQSASLGNTAKEPSYGVNTALQHKHSVSNHYLLHASKTLLSRHNVTAPRSGKPHRTRTCHEFRQSSAKKISIALSENPKKSRASIADVQKCGSWCSCPICFESLALEKAGEISKAIAWAKSNGLIPVMIAFTVRHKKWDRLADIDTRLSKAMSHFLSGATWKSFRAYWGLDHYIMNRDTTYRESNGFHPHRHMLAFLNPAVAVLNDDRDFSQEMSDRWLEILPKYGLFASEEHGLKVSDHEGASSTYLSKLGMTVNESGNLSLEMTMNRTKDSMNIWDVLRFADMGLRRFERVFVEYVKHMSGKTWIRFSKGFKDILEGFDYEPSISSDEESNRFVRWLEIGDYWWDVVRASDRGIAKLVRVAGETRSKEMVAELLNAMRHDLYLSGKWFRTSACEFVELVDPNQLVIHEDWLNLDTS